MRKVMQTSRLVTVAVVLKIVTFLKQVWKKKMTLHWKMKSH